MNCIVKELVVMLLVFMLVQTCINCIIFTCVCFIGHDGDDFDVQCGRSNDVIITDVDFTVKDPPERLKKSVEEINLMAPKQQVSILAVYKFATVYLNYLFYIIVK